jgi:hypothetical protein
MVTWSRLGILLECSIIAVLYNVQYQFSISTVSSTIIFYYSSTVLSILKQSSSFCCTSMPVLKAWPYFSTSDFGNDTKVFLRVADVKLLVDSILDVLAGSFDLRPFKPEIGNRAGVSIIDLESRPMFTCDQACNSSKWHMAGGSSFLTYSKTVTIEGGYACIIATCRIHDCILLKS